MPVEHDPAAIESRAGVDKPDPILVIDGLYKTFGGLVAVDVERLQVEAGWITALIGPNGAGKTTLFNLLTGFDRPGRGRFSFMGRDLTGQGPHRIARAGMVRTFQLTKSLSKMSVMDNMLLAGADQRGERFGPNLVRRSWRAQERALEERAVELLERFRLVDMRAEYAGTLSGGQRKLLEMARALMVRPQLILLDEPMAGVNPALVESLLGHVHALKEGGMSVLFVEHDMDVVMGISDWVVCMAEGLVIAEGPPSAVVADPMVRAAYLGTRADAPMAATRSADPR